jgi:hypothetical protein
MVTDKQLSEGQEKFRKKMLNPFLFWLYTFGNVPAGWMAGMRLKTLTREKAVSTIPFKWLNKNPFQSIYFAVQSMAAELSTASIALLAIADRKPSVATIIVDLKAEFPKRATAKTTFTCEEGDKIFAAVDLAVSSGEPQTVTAKTVGTMADGTIVSVFYFTWSFKQRSK